MRRHIKRFIGGNILSQEIEIEYKNLLTKKEFDYLLTHLPFPDKGRKQTNYYFETENFAIRKNKSALRIRESNGVYHLTLKEPHSTGLLETHDLLTEQEALSWLQGHIIEKENTTKQLANFSISPQDLIYFGSLYTLRREVNYKNVLLVLDYSSYNGKSDYEFELEAPNEKIGIDVFETILKQYNIEKKETSNKIHRFFTTLK